jgi:hypothetical protein
MGGARVTRIERFADRDIALLFCNAVSVTHLNVWLTHRVQALTDVSSFGYPHAVTRNANVERMDVVFRAYKGYVITTRGWERLPGDPAVYEMSCPFPQAMSGAPLLFSKDDVLAVAGVVLGVGTVEYGGLPQSVGITLMAEEIVHLHSEILGGQIAASLGFDGAELRMPGLRT